jgi:hypothetical protein
MRSANENTTFEHDLKFVGCAGPRSAIAIEVIMDPHSQWWASISMKSVKASGNLGKACASRIKSSPFDN